jgi:hypothetical protein
MTPERLRFAQHLMTDHSRTIPQICHDLGGIPSSTLYHYLHADGGLKDPGRRLLAGAPPERRPQDQPPQDRMGE